MSGLADCSYTITKGRKELWRIELTMLENIHSFCKENGIRYFLIDGSAIGAVRHKGFVPWDDDVDIGMLREDFETFIKLFPRKLGHIYCFQYGYKNSGVLESGTFLRIRNINSTAIIKSQMQKNTHTHGVFIEVYPFDNVPDSRIKRRLLYKLSTIFKGILDERFDGCKVHPKLKPFEILMKAFSDEKIWNMWKRICTHYNKKTCKCVNTVSLPLYAKKEYEMYPIEWISQTITVPFENIEVEIPVENDKCLCMTYGDYMQLPPAEERGTVHNSVVFYDPFHSPAYYADMEIPRRYFRGETDLSPL